MANNEYKSSYLDSLASKFCLYSINVISLYRNNKVELFKTSKYEGNSA